LKPQSLAHQCRPAGAGPPRGGPRGSALSAAAACCRHAASHSESAALGPPAEAASLSHSDSDGPSLTRSLAWGSAWQPGAPRQARLLAGGPAGAGEAALSAKIKSTMTGCQALAAGSST